MTSTAGAFSRLMDYESGMPNPAVNDGKHGGKSGNTDSTYEAKSSKPSDRLIARIHDRNFNVDQMEPIFRQRGNQLIISGAGSGKTTVVVFKLLYDQLRGELSRVVEINGTNQRAMERVLVATFLRSGADELKQRYRKWARVLDVTDMSQFIQFRTLHAEFKNALESMGISVSIITDRDNMELLRKAVSTNQQNSRRRLTSDDYQNLHTAFTKTRNTLGETRFHNEVYGQLGLTAVDVDLVLSEWRSYRADRGVVDFEDLQEIMYDLLCLRKDEVAIERVRARFPYVYIDEFQDTSEIQYAILSEYFKGAKKVIAIGDDDQTIYSWRGSSSHIITESFPQDWDPTQMHLEVNYRCPSKILNSVIPSINKNVDRFPKDLRSSREGGDLRHGYFGNQAAMSTALLEGVVEDQQTNRSVVVLCRVNSDGFLPALALAKRGIKFSLSSNRMTFDSVLGRLALAIPSLLTRTSGLKVSTALKDLVYFNERSQVDMLLRRCKANGQHFWELDPEDLAHSVPELSRHLFAIMKGISDVPEMDAVRFLYDYYIQQYAGSNNSYAESAMGILSAVRGLLDMGAYSDLQEFQTELEDLAEVLKYSVSPTSSAIRVATVHEYKGKEADSVYLWNDSVGTFPHAQSVSTPADLEEERRVHYIGVTRAIQRLTILASKSAPGTFLKEMDLSESTNISPTLLKATL